MNKKFKQFIMGCIAGTAILITSAGLLLFATSMIDSHKGQDTQDTKSKTQQEVSQKDVDKAYELLKQSAEQTFQNTQYKLTKESEDDMVILYLHVSVADIKNDMTTEEWKELKANTVYAQTVWQEELKENNLTTDFVICIGDLNENVLFLTVANGQVVFDNIKEIEIGEF